jgi:diamine N-acetyltransferase
MITGERVRLRPHERDDLPRYVSWLANPLLRENLALAVPFGVEDESRWFESLRSLPDLERPFAIDAKNDEGSWHHVGSVGMQSFDWRNRSAEIGLFIGE